MTLLPSNVLYNVKKGDKAVKNLIFFKSRHIRGLKMIDYSRISQDFVDQRFSLWTFQRIKQVSLAQLNAGYIVKQINDIFCIGFQTKTI